MVFARQKYIFTIFNYKAIIRPSKCCCQIVKLQSGIPLSGILSKE